MKQHEKLFLEALKASLTGQSVRWDFTISQETWRQLFELAIAQKVLPLVFEAVYSCPSIRATEFPFFTLVKHRCIESMMLQTQKTAEFLDIYRRLDREGIHPLVVKGIVCRQLYPKPDLRASADEDILVNDTEFVRSMKLLRDCGLRQLDTPGKPEEADEIGFLSEKGNAYIELHKYLFPAASPVWGELNGFFNDARNTGITVKIQGMHIHTMEPTMHLFYLICHAFKHFIGSGFGIRQVCDMAMFANAYGREIDWQKLFGQCREIRADKFTAALFQIGKKYLVFDEEKACYPKEWREIEIDETEMLLELLQSGIYGQSTMSRKHSSNITMDAVASQKTGKKANGLKASLFPSAKSMEGSYTYLKKRPYLLPVAWSERILKYVQETKKVQHDDPAEAMTIGSQRIELLKRYGILEK